jgi:hypothetical protein
MLDEPDASAALAAASAFLRARLVPLLPAREAFEARVVASLLEMVGREVTVGVAGERAETERLRGLLGQPGDLAQLNGEFTRLIANGALDAGDPAVADHLWATTLEKLAVDQPRYAAYQRVLSERAALASKE